MTVCGQANLLYALLSDHFLRRLRHAMAGEALITALDQNLLSLVTFSQHGICGGAYKGGIAATGKSAEDVRRSLRSSVESSRSQSSKFVVEGGEITLVREDERPQTKFSGGRSSLTRAHKLGTAEAPSPGAWEAGTICELRQLVRDCARTPDVAELATLLLVADAVAKTGIDRAELLRLLKQDRPIVSVVCSIKGFEDRFIDLLDRGFITPGAVLRSDGYEPWSRADLKATLKREGNRRITCFQGRNSDPDNLSEWILQAARRRVPILCLGESLELPSRLETAADLSLIVGPLTVDILRYLIWAISGECAGPDVFDGIDCMRLGLVDVALAVQPGKTLEETIALLRRLAVNEDWSTPLSKHTAKSPAKDRSGNRAKPTSGNQVFLPNSNSDPWQNVVVPKVEDLDGYGRAKSWALDLKADLENWRSGKLHWGELSSKVLLSGPPGTGKTLFARALSSTLQLPLFCSSVSTWLEPSYLGEVVGRMRLSFDEAMASSPSILFIDEIDGIGARTNHSRVHADYWNSVVNRLLELLDGASKLNGVVIVGATNRPDDIDKALIRPGRLAPHIQIELPDAAALRGIFRHHLRDDLEHIVSTAPALHERHCEVTFGPDRSPQ